MSAIFADSGQGITSLPTKIMSCVSVQVSGDYAFRNYPAQARGAVVGLLGAEAWFLAVWWLALSFASFVFHVYWKEKLPVRSTFFVINCCDFPSMFLLSIDYK